MSEGRDIYRSQVRQYQTTLPPRRDMQLNIFSYRQSRFWHDDPANYTHDECTLISRRGVLVTPDYLTSRDMGWLLLSAGVPLEEQTAILEKITQFAQVAVPELPITVLILHIRVRSLGSVDYQDIIDFVEREPINDNLHASPTPVTHDNLHASPTPVTPTAHASTVSLLGTYMSLTIPASRSSIEGLKKVRFDSLEEDVIRETPTCAICIKDFVECVDELITSLPCAHHYHVDCIVQWLKRDHICPLCRYRMPPARMDENRDGDGDAVEPSNP
ncbi:RING-H2 finger protein ATL13-like [Rosa sericea]